MRNIPKITASTLSAAILLALLTACGGGGSGMVRSSPAPLTPPSTPPPAPPPATSVGPCTMPITGDCVVSANASMGGGRTSAYALVVRDSGLMLGYNGSTDLAPGVYRFDAGTTVERGGLMMSSGNTLVSQLHIAAGASMSGFGVIIGNVVNEGGLYFGGDIQGSVENRGLMIVPSASATHTGRPALVNHITGDFRQMAAGTLDVSVPTTDAIPDYIYTLKVSGQAQLAGTLQLRSPGDGWDAYPMPTTAVTAHVIHADGGVFGTFDRWTSPGLFIDGGLRYGSNDVWFDLTRVSVQAATASNGLGGALTVVSAANFDRALAVADGFAVQPNAAQKTFLASAAKLLWMSDAAQATRALDSLSGAIHADALQSTGDGAATRMLVASHLDAIAPGQALGAWLGEDGSGAITGVDQWLSPHLLVGVHASQRHATDMASANATDLGSGAYLRWIGDHGWYAGLDASIAHRSLTAGRGIDFGKSGQWLARSRRSMDAVSASIEAGKRLPMLGGSLTPFLGAGFSSVQASAASEQGTSGFELQLADTHLRGSRASAGMRFARDWRWGDTRWLQISAASGIDYNHWNGHQQAAFLGVPDAWFDLPASSIGRQRWTSLGLQGGLGHGWTWNAARSTGRAFGSARAWQLSLRRDW